MIHFTRIFIFAAVCFAYSMTINSAFSQPKKIEHYIKILKEVPRFSDNKRVIFLVRKLISLSPLQAFKYYKLGATKVDFHEAAWRKLELTAERSVLRSNLSEFNKKLIANKIFKASIIDFPPPTPSPTPV